MVRSDRIMLGRASHITLVSPRGRIAIRGERASFGVRLKRDIQRPGEHNVDRCRRTCPPSNYFRRGHWRPSHRKAVTRPSQHSAHQHYVVSSAVSARRPLPSWSCLLNRAMFDHIIPHPNPPPTPAATPPPPGSATPRYSPSPHPQTHSET